MQGENVGRWGQTSADDHKTLAYFRGRQSSGGEATEDAGQGKEDGAGYCHPSIRLCGWDPGAGPRHQAVAPLSPSGAELQGSQEAAPFTQGNAAAPRHSIPDSGKGADSGTQQDERCRASDVLCGNNSVTIKTYWPYVHSSSFLAFAATQIKGQRTKTSMIDIWEARHIKLINIHIIKRLIKLINIRIIKRHLNQFDVSSLPHVKMILVLSLICSVASGKDDAMPPVAK